MRENVFEGMTMKNMRDHLFALGASAVLTLSVVLAQDQAPVVAPPPVEQPEAAQAAPEPAAPADAAPAAAAAPAVVPRATSALNKLPPPAIGTPASALSRRSAPQVARRLNAFSSGTARPSAEKPAAVPASATSEDADASAETKEPKAKTTTPSLKFDNTPADIIVAAYCEQTGKTPLWAPDVPKANITLKSQQGAELTKEEYIEAIEVVLSMNGILLEPFGDKFIKILARKTVRTDGIKIIMEPPEGGHPEKSKTVSQMIQLKAITVAEAQKALEGFKKPDGLMQTFERTNSLLVTDTQENVNRMLEIVKFIDQPLVATEEVNVRQIRFAKAEDIKKRIEELVAESQKQTQAKDEIKANTSGAPGITRTAGTASAFSTRPLPPGLTRLGSSPAAPATPNATLETLVSDADRGMIRGKVQIIADERTNQLIIITRAENMTFFERIITILDVETTPDVKVEVMRLEFADSEEVSSMLNDLIGNATSQKSEKSTSSKGSTTKSSTKSSSTPGSTSGSRSGMTPGSAPYSGYSGSAESGRSTSLADAMAARANRTAEAEGGETAQSKLGQLSKENIKILSDKRINALVIMGSVGDLAAIKAIIKSMDVQLSQVLIETVVLEVRLDDTLTTGIDWVQRNVSKIDDSRGIGVGGEGKNAPLNLFGNALALATNALGEATGTLSPYPNFQYYASLKKLNLDGVVSASKTDGRSKILTSPILMTQDNKEATLEATEMQYLYKGMRYMGGSINGNGSNYEPDIEQRDVGLTVKITPRISPNGMVILTVDEKFEEVAGSQEVPGSGKWPIITTRKMAADISLQNGDTVILGGLVKNKYINSSTGIPLLKDIPYIGQYLFGSVSKSQNRSELVVFLTPHVFKTSDDALFEARRRKEYLNAYDVWTKGWSSSKIADPVSADDLKFAEHEKDRLKNSWRTYSDSLDKQIKLDATNRIERTRAINLLKTQQNLNEPASFGILKETTSEEVIKPEGASESTGPQTEAAPVPPAVEEPKKSWWKIF